MGRRWRGGDRVRRLAEGRSFKGQNHAWALEGAFGSAAQGKFHVGSDGSVFHGESVSITKSSGVQFNARTETMAIKSKTARSAQKLAL